MKQTKSIMTLLLTTSCLLGSVQAASTMKTKTTSPLFPKGCEASGYGYNEQYLVLNQYGEQTYFLIQNRSHTSIELEHQETRDVFMSPTMKAKIDADHWAAFASDVANSYFKCFSRTGDSTTPVNCSDVIEICQYPRVKFATSNMGNYWVSTNKSRAQVIQDSVDKGILLRW